MDGAAKSIDSLVEKILPKQPYYLSLSPTCKYRIRPGENRIDEQDHRPLQYTTLVGGEADRGVLITRAYFSVRDEPKPFNAPAPTMLNVDPNKPRKKMTLKDYKSKKIEGDSPPKLEKEKPNGLPPIKEKIETGKQSGLATAETDSRPETNKVVSKVETTRRHSPSPERKKRVGEADEGSRPIKRTKVGDAIPNGTAPRPSKDSAPQKPVKNVPLVKNEVKESKPLSVTNGKTASSGSALRAASPKHAPLVNGHGKTNSTQSAHKKVVSNSEPVSKVVPKLLSPLYIAELSMEKSSDSLKESVPESRQSPKKKPLDLNGLKQQTKRQRDDRETSPSVKKRKVLPPLLSPTLPAVVMEELARLEKKGGSPPSKDMNLQNSSHSSDSFVARKPPKSPAREETVHVDNKKEAPTRYMVTMKYKKRHAKTIERLLNLPSGGKKKMESLKKEDRAVRDSGNTEPNTARKRPRPTADTNETLKPPKTSDTLRPSTPSKQSTSMSRIASNSSQVDTPGAANSLTPSALSSGKRREPIAPDKLQRAQRLHGAHKFFMELGTKLKHERDAIMKNKVGALQERDHQTAVAAGIQSLLLYMHAVKLQSDAFDLERSPRRPQSWKEVLPLFPVIRSDCSRNAPLSALLLRVQGICMNYLGRALWFLPGDSDAAEKALSVSKDEADIWRLAELARRKLGTFDGSSDSSDGGVVGKLIDRLGPWTTPDEVVPVALEVMRNIIRIDGPWKPIDELAKLARCTVKAMSG
ncbi:hypothetical protein GGS21DRAFT_307857 [Xylaria nigripes]|nr:hypothetical protein GGS21DRAFT_307857 [Xylaria nigripes]